MHRPFKNLAVGDTGFARGEHGVKTYPFFDGLKECNFVLEDGSKFFLSRLEMVSNKPQKKEEGKNV